MVSLGSLKTPFLFVATVLFFLISRSPLHCALSASIIGSVSHPAETGLLIPSDKRDSRKQGLRNSPLIDRRILRDDRAGRLHSEHALRKRVELLGIHLL